MRRVSRWTISEEGKTTIELPQDHEIIAVGERWASSEEQDDEDGDPVREIALWALYESSQKSVTRTFFFVEDSDGSERLGQTWVYVDTLSGLLGPSGHIFEDVRRG